ncbi:MAG: hypothetical protein ACI9DC_000967 [Gammaproteobacteria bacterium]
MPFNVGLTVFGAVSVGLMVLGAVIVGAVRIGLRVVGVLNLGVVSVGVLCVGLRVVEAVVVGNAEGERDPGEGRLPLAAGTVDCLGVRSNVLEVGDVGVRKPFASMFLVLAGATLRRFALPAFGSDSGLSIMDLRSICFAALRLSVAAGFAAARERAPGRGTGACALGTASRNVGILMILGCELAAPT